MERRKKRRRRYATGPVRGSVPKAESINGNGSRRKVSRLADILIHRATGGSPSARVATAVSDTARTNAGNACGAGRWPWRATVLNPPMQGNRHAAQGNVPGGYRGEKPKPVPHPGPPQSPAQPI